MRVGTTVSVEVSGELEGRMLRACDHLGQHRAALLRLALVEYMDNLDRRLILEGLRIQ